MRLAACQFNLIDIAQFPKERLRGNMLKKRAILYFLVIAFPMGLGAGASTWLSLPIINLSIVKPEASLDSVADNSSPEITIETEPKTHFPDFGAIHPLVVGTFTLLFCAGILIAADRPKQK
jgi:hypothetical protein